MANPPRTHTTTVVGGGFAAWHKVLMPPKEWEPGTRVAVIDLTSLPPGLTPNLGAIDLQRRIGDWHRARFPEAEIENVALKLSEEAGEVARAVNGQVGKNSATGGGSVPDEAADVVIAAMVLVERWCPGVDVLQAVENKLTTLTDPESGHPSSVQARPAPQPATERIPWHQARGRHLVENGECLGICLAVSWPVGDEALPGCSYAVENRTGWCSVKAAPDGMVEVLVDGDRPGGGDR